jgi:phosphoenolpyruvate-protein phosphotransferase (PTS system enzyme I)
MSSHAHFLPFCITEARLRNVHNAVVEWHRRVLGLNGRRLENQKPAWFNYGCGGGENTAACQGGRLPARSASRDRIMREIMETLTGRPVSPGYAAGTAVVYGHGGHIEVPRHQINQEDIDGELERFRHALQQARNELQLLERRVALDLGRTYSSIFSAHLALLHDRQFTEQIEHRVRSQLVNVEQSLDAQIAELVRLLHSLGNEYLRERASDMRDLGNRLLRHLLRGNFRTYANLVPNSVIVARELLPSDTIDLDRAHVVGIVTEEGGENSHAAILARALAIPAVTAVASATARIASGTRVLVDGRAGTVILTPTDTASSDMRRLKSKYEDDAAAVISEQLECVTQDGVRISLMANLNRVEELELVNIHQLGGVGLFRTEILYMNSPVAPTYEQHFAVYQYLAKGLGGKPLAIRTLDLGGDKIPQFLLRHHEENPALGFRGLRFSIAKPELFTTQLRAILAVCDREELGVRVLLPMVLGESDLMAAAHQVDTLANELRLKSLPPLGAMIETPSALFSLKEILQRVDFVSIGTNDLTQFMLAADREAAELMNDYSALHPSVLRAIRMVIKTCEDAGKELCVCGEMAGDAGAACLLVGLGARQLSMSPVRAGRVRVAIRQSRCSALTELAEQALSADSVATVKALLRDFEGRRCSKG